MNVPQQLRARPLGPVPLARPRVLISAPAPDGYHHEVKRVARALLSAGHEVICTGMRRASESVPAAIPADKPLVGLSFLAGPRPPIPATGTGLPAPARSPGGAQARGCAGATGNSPNSIRAHLVFTPGAEIGTVVETLDQCGIGVSSTPEQSC